MFLPQKVLMLSLTLCLVANSMGLGCSAQIKSVDTDDNVTPRPSETADVTGQDPESQDAPGEPADPAEPFEPAEPSNPEPPAEGEKASFKALDIILRDKVATKSINGFALMIFNDKDELLLKSEDGVCASSSPYCPDGNQPFTTDLVTSIASSTKWITSSVILSSLDELVEQRKVATLDASLSVTVGDLLGQACKAKSMGRGSTITMRQLLSFTSGLPSDNACVRSRTDTIQSCACKILWEAATKEVASGGTPSNAHPPGSVYKYGATHHTVAGAMIEKATGRTFDTLFTEKVKTPLNFSAAYSQSPNLSGSLRTSVSEYAKFVKAMFHDGSSLATKRVLSSEASAAQESNQTDKVVFMNSPQKGFDYGLNVWRWCYKAYALSDLLNIDPANALSLQDRSCKSTFQTGHGGKGGYQPFIDRKRGVYGVFAIREESTGGGDQYSEEEQGLTAFVRLYAGLAAETEATAEK